MQPKCAVYLQVLGDSDLSVLEKLHACPATSRDEILTLSGGDKASSRVTTVERQCMVSSHQPESSPVRAL